MLDKIADEKGAKADLPSDKIKELTRKYTWKERYNRLKVIGRKIIDGEIPLPEELIELEMLFSEETNNRRRQVFTDKSISIDKKYELLKKLRDNNIFILSHGAIESYYPKGISGEDKPTKALNAIGFLKLQEDCKIHLPTIKVGGNDVCELELIYEKIFE